MSTITTESTDNDGYERWLAEIQSRFLLNTGENGKPLFTTDVEDLFTIYRLAFPEEVRQHYTCHACRDFLNRYGSLVTIDEKTGRTESALWRVGDAPDLFTSVVFAMRAIVLRARVTGVFLSRQEVLGKPVTDAWHHPALYLPPYMRYQGTLKSAEQTMAEKHEDRTMLQRALIEFAPGMVDQALVLLEADQLYRSEHVIGPARFLHKLQEASAKAKNPTLRNNLIWLAVATAPAGFCHVKSTMIGTLLDDIASGLDFPAVSKRFAEKMHPLQYQRPQVAPSEGNIAQAEKIVTTLASANAFKRRFCRLDEIDALWRPPARETPKGEGVFANVTSKDKAPKREGMYLPALTYTWRKFQADVLPSAWKIELLTPRHSSYAALMTAVDPEAPPILQWDTPEQRNPVNWYLWTGGSDAAQWGLNANTYVNVQAICYGPHMWYSKPALQHAKGVLFVLEGAKESRRAGIALFPEILKNEYREIRSTIEAYSNQSQIEGFSEPHACGLMFSNSAAPDVLLRVTANGFIQDYVLDRWD